MVFSFTLLTRDLKHSLLRAKYCMFIISQLRKEVMFYFTFYRWESRGPRTINTCPGLLSTNSGLRFKLI